MATARALRPRLLPTAAVLVACVGCDSTDQPMAPDSAPPAYAISDAAHEGMPHFFLLPPLVDAPVARGTFDATLAPTVEICALRSSACGEIIASFTKDAGPGGEVITVDREREQYQVDWKTDEFALSDATNYRIVVRVSAVLLGYVDVDVARNASQFKNLNTNEVIGLVDGRTLPIKFRAERGIPGRLAASPSEARVGEGDQLQLRAVVYDLHDEVVAETFRVRWTTSDTDIALVDDTGLLLGKAAGRATVGLSLGSLQALVATVNIFARRLAFVSTRPAPGGVNDIYTVNGLGGDLKLLTGEPGEPYVSNQPAWSPGGTKLAYQYAQRDIVVMNDDGTGKTHLTQNLASQVYLDANPVWSPDGARIAFQRDVIAEKQAEIYVIHQRQPHRAGRCRSRAPCPRERVGETAHDLGRAPRRLPLRRRGFERRGGAWRAVGRAGAHLLDRLRRSRVRRIEVRQRSRPALPHTTTTDEIVRGRLRPDRPPWAACTTTLCRQLGHPDLSRLPAGAPARHGGAFGRRRRRELRRLPPLPLALAEQRVRAACRWPAPSRCSARWAELIPKADWAPRMFRAKTTFEALARDAVEGYFHGVSNCRTRCARAVLGALPARLQGYSAIEVFHEPRRKPDRRSAVADPVPRLQDLAGRATSSPRSTAPAWRTRSRCGCR